MCVTGDCAAVTPSQVDQPQTTIGDQPQPQTTVGEQPQTTVGDQPHTTVGDQPQPQTTVGDQPQTTVGDQPQTTIGEQPQTTIAAESTPSSSHLPAITATSASDITPSSHSTNTTSSNVIKPSSGYSTDSTIIDPTTPTCTTSEHLCPRSTVTPSTSHRSTGHDVRPQTSVSEGSTTSATVAVQSSLPELRETDSHTATALLAGATGGGVAVILLAAAVVILGITCTVKMRVNTKKKGNDTCLMEKENNIELSSNAAYTCTNTVAIQEVPVPITTTSNSAYARSGHVSTSDEIYSYIPDESELASSWKSATCIPTSLNDSYTVTTQVKQVPENSQNGLLDDDYVVNEPIYATADGDTDLVNSSAAPIKDDYVVSQLVYATADGDTDLVKSSAAPIKDDYVVSQLVYATADEDTDLMKSSAAPIEDEYIVNQLVYATAGRDTEAVRPHETSPDKPSVETATNEAYVCSNPATDPVTSNEAHALPVNSSEVYELYDTVLGNIDV